MTKLLNIMHFKRSGSIVQGGFLSLAWVGQVVPHIRMGIIGRCSGERQRWEERRVWTETPGILWHFILDLSVLMEKVYSLNLGSKVAEGRYRPLLPHSTCSTASMAQTMMLVLNYASRFLNVLLGFWTWPCRFPAMLWWIVLHGGVCVRADPTGGERQIQGQPSTDVYCSGRS